MDLFWSMLWFFLFFAWIWLLIMIFSDIFRSHDLSGWGKAFWTIFVVILPWLGVLIYLIARGGSMQERAMAQAVQQEKAQREYIQQVSASSAGLVCRRTGETGQPEEPGSHHRRGVRRPEGQAPQLRITAAMPGLV